MAVYNMPPDTREREKIVGGVLDLFQLLWIAIGAILYAIHAIIMFRFVSYICFFAGVPFLVFGFMFALRKKDDMPYPTYLKYKLIYNRKTRYYVNAGYHNELEFSGEEIKND